MIDPVEKFLPEYKGLKVNGCEGRSGYNCPGVAPSRPINIEDPMKHTSGLPAGSDARGSAGPPETLGRIRVVWGQIPLLFEPGIRPTTAMLGITFWDASSKWSRSSHTISFSNNIFSDLWG